MKTLEEYKKHIEDLIRIVNEYDNVYNCEINVYGICNGNIGNRQEAFGMHGMHDTAETLSEINKLLDKAVTNKRKEIGKLIYSELINLIIKLDDTKDKQQKGGE